MTPYQTGGRGPFKVRIGHVTLSTGAYTLADAKHVAAQIARWRGKQGREHARPSVLAMLVKDDAPLSLGQAYEKALAGTLDAFMAEYETNTNALNLRPYVAEWYAAKRKGKKGAASSDAYLRQIDALYEDEPLTLATFKRSEVLQRLRNLDVDDPTRNRYKAAASSFAQYLVDREVLDANFVLTIKGYFSENPERVVWYSMDDAKRLIGALPQPYAALSAYAAGFAAEWGAISRLKVEEVSLDGDPVTARVQGRKRAWRDRVNPLVPELAWTLDHLRPALKGRLGLVFGGVEEWTAIDTQRRVATDLELHANGEEKFGQHSLHDWRHSHAVWLLKAGYSEQIVASHLGHKNTDLVRKRYGIYQPDRHDYAKPGERKLRRAK